MPFNITSTGGSGSGAPGPRGQQGLPGAAGAGFEPVTLELNGPVGFFRNPDGVISRAWNFATNVRVSSFSNRDKYIEGYIQSINHENGNVSVTVLRDFTDDDYIPDWIMELTGERGADGADGAGYAPVTLYPYSIGNTSGGAKNFGTNPLPVSWSEGSRVRVLPLNNGAPIPSIFMDAYIQSITPGRDDITLYVDYFEGTWTGIQYEEWWMVLSGERGADGEGFNFRGEWVTDTFYSKNDVITQNGSSYIANYDYQDNSGPSLDGDLWAILAQKGSDGDGSGTDNHGDFQFTAATANVNNSQTLRIESRRFDGTQASALTLNPGDPSASLSATNIQGQSFSDLWSSATWNGETVDILDTPDIINFLNEINSYASVQRVIINESAPINVTSLGWTTTNVQFGVAVPAEELTQITDITFIYAFTSQVRLDYDNGAIDISGNGMNINLTTTRSRDINLTSDDDINIISADDATLRASGDDLHLHAGDDIRFISSWDDLSHGWTMDSEGRLQLPGNGYIENPKDSSGDGYLNDTLKLVPDNLLDSDQYLIIDPTAPNHIHIRAGGVQDYSNAELILGGERAGVHVSDPAGDVWVQTKKEDYNWSWQNVNPNDGTTYITSSSMSEPDIGDFTVQNGIKYTITSVSRDEPNGNTAYMATGSNGELLNFVSLAYYTFTRDNGNYAWRFEAIDDAPALVLPPEEPVIVNMAVPGDITLSAYNGIKIAASSGFGIEFPDQTIQTTAYIPGGDAPVETLFTVNGGTTAAQPTFNGSPLFSGSYVRTGQLVHFQIQVDMDNISDFGTGQYYVDLPFAAKYNYTFKDGSLIDASSSVMHNIGGHVTANTERIFLTFTSSSGHDDVFDHNSPVTLSSADSFYISGTYIAS